MQDTTKVRCWKISATDKAILVTKVPFARDPHPADAVWIPKSQIEHISTVESKEGEWPEIVITISEWVADRKGLL